MGKRFLLTCASVVALWIGCQMKAEAVVLINEVLADPAGDANKDGLIHSTQDEFIELVNTQSDPVSLAGWTLSDLLRRRHVFEDSSYIPGGGFFVVFGGGKPDGFASYSTASGGTLALNNTGDTIKLRNEAGELMDELIYGKEGGKDVSLTRSPDALGAFAAHTDANGWPYSPGLSVRGDSFWMAAGESPESTRDEAGDYGSKPDSAGASYSDFDPARHPDANPDPTHPAVPEPLSSALFGMGLLGFAFRRRT